MAERLNLQVDDGVAELMTQLAGGERRRGQWLSDLVRAMHEQTTVTTSSDLETTKLALAGLAGQHKQLETRILKIEQQIIASHQ